MFILLTPVCSPSPAFLNHRVSLSWVSHSKVLLFPARADTYHVYASKRTWWDPDEDSVRKERRFRNRLLDDEEEDVDKRSWWSRSADDYDGYYDDESIFLDDEDEVGWTDVGFFKVLKSYGWMLPAIILSMLLATGPKAFLMALALPLGQTALSLAADKLWGKARAAPKPPRYTSRESKYTNSYAATDRKPRTPKNVSEENSSSSSSDSWATSGKASRAGPTFGGWDELDIKEPGKQPLEPKQKTRPSSAGPIKGSSKKRPSKMVRRGRNSEMPLLLRLLIAVFPFLGSWVKIL